MLAAMALPIQVPNGGLLPSESMVWTTADELNYVRGLYARKKLRALRGYVRHAHDRKWFGPGMRVEAGLVILEARDLLKALEDELAN